jgi:hypothetical protein
MDAGIQKIRTADVKMHRRRANICWRPVPAATPNALCNLTKTAETRSPGLQLEAAAALNRIAEVEWSREVAEPPVIDKDWEEWVTLRVSPHRGLGEAARQGPQLAATEIDTPAW